MNTERARAMTVRGDMQLRAPAWAHQAGGGDGAVQIERGACEELAQAHVQSWLSKAGRGWAGCALSHRTIGSGGIG